MPDECHVRILTNATRRLYVGATNDINAAISREKRIKSWRRVKKLALAEGMNPSSRDLSAEWYGPS